MKLNTESQDYKAEKIIEVFEFCKVVKEIFEAGSIDDKNLVLKALGARFSLKDQILTVELAKPFQLIQEGRTSKMVVNPKYATLETRINSTHSPEEQALIKNGGEQAELVYALVG